MHFLRTVGVAFGLSLTWTLGAMAAGGESPDFSLRCDALLSSVQQVSALQAFRRISAPGASIVLGKFKAIYPLQELLISKVENASSDEQAEILDWVAAQIKNKALNGYLISLYLGVGSHRFTHHLDRARDLETRLKQITLDTLGDQEAMSKLMARHLERVGQSEIDLTTFCDLIDSRRVMFLRNWPLTLNEIDEALLRADLSNPAIRAWVEKQLASGDVETEGLLKELMASGPSTSVVVNEKAPEPVKVERATIDSAQLYRELGLAQRKLEEKWAARAASGQDAPPAKEVAAEIVADLDVLLRLPSGSVLPDRYMNVGNWLFHPSAKVRAKALQVIRHFRSVPIFVIYRVIQSLKYPWEMSKGEELFQEADAWPMIEAMYGTNTALRGNHQLAAMLRPLILTQNGTRHRAHQVDAVLEKLVILYPGDFRSINGSNNAGSDWVD